MSYYPNQSPFWNFMTELDPNNARQNQHIQHPWFTENLAGDGPSRPHGPRHGHPHHGPTPPPPPPEHEGPSSPPDYDEKQTSSSGKEKEKDEPNKPYPPNEPHEPHGPPPHHHSHCGSRGGWGGRQGHCRRGGPGGFPFSRRHGPGFFPWGAWARGSDSASTWAPFFAMNGNDVNMEGLRQFFQDNFGFEGPNSTKRDADKDFAPPVDVFDTPDAYVIHISLAGAKKEDIGVSWDSEKSEVLVAGVIHRPGDEEFLKNLVSEEREVGAFERKVKLGGQTHPANVDSDAITAKMENGVLVVHVPKIEEFVEIKKVDIQ